MPLLNAYFKQVTIRLHLCILICAPDINRIELRLRPGFHLLNPFGSLFESEKAHKAGVENPLKSSEPKVMCAKVRNIHKAVFMGKMLIVSVCTFTRLPGCCVLSVNVQSRNNNNNNSRRQQQKSPPANGQQLTIAWRCCCHCCICHSTHNT